jgi:hypothetical protein
MGVGSAPKSLQTAGKTVDVVEVQQPAGNELACRCCSRSSSLSWRAQISPAVVEFAEKHFGFKTNGKVNR